MYELSICSCLSRRFSYFLLPTCQCSPSSRSSISTSLTPRPGKKIEDPEESRQKSSHLPLHQHRFAILQVTSCFFFFLISQYLLHPISPARNQRPCTGLGNCSTTQRHFHCKGELHSPPTEPAHSEGSFPHWELLTYFFHFLLL